MRYFFAFQCVKLPEKERKNIFQADSDFYLFHEINDYEYDNDGIQRDLSASIKYYLIFDS